MGKKLLPERSISIAEENQSFLRSWWNGFLRNLRRFMNFVKCSSPEYTNVSHEDPNIVRENELNYLFVGLNSAGISSTAKTAFGVPVNKTKKFQITEFYYFMEDFKGSPLKLKIIDVPGLCKGDTMEQDAELITALQAHLKLSIPKQIPNAIFIVSRFDDVRFEGEGSEFSKMLRALRFSCKHWAAHDLSNVILVLTHASKVKDNIDFKIQKFQEAFHLIFPIHKTTPVECVLVDNNNEFSNEKLKVFARKEFDTFLINTTSFQNEWVPNDISVDSLLPQSKSQIGKLLLHLLQGNNANLDPHSEDENESDTFFRGYKIGKVKTSKTHKRTVLLPQAQILMGDGYTEYPACALKPGDKLLDKDLKMIVVADIIKYDAKDFKTTAFGVHFVNAEDMCSEREQIVWGVACFENRSPKLKKVPLKPFEQRYQKDCVSSFYSIVLNTGSNQGGTFIADNVVVQEFIE